MSKPIVVVGSANIDLVLRVPHIPRPGESVHGDQFMMVPGGKGANQAVAAAKLGGNVYMVARTGTDLFAEVSFNSYAAAGLNTTYITRDPGVSSGVALILVEDSGQNTISVAPQANAHLSPADVDRAGDILSSAGVLLTQQEVPLATTRYAMQMARAANVTTIHNPAPAFESAETELLRLIDIITPNQIEAEMLTGIRVEGEEDADRAAAALLEAGTGAAVITLGAMGAYFATATGERGFVPAYTVHAVDTTAAGDAFNGALAVALTRGKTLADAILYANAAGALCATRLGAQPSLPTGAEVDLFMADQVS